jgi:hypothetical protein
MDGFHNIREAFAMMMPEMKNDCMGRKSRRERKFPDRRSYGTEKKVCKTCMSLVRHLLVTPPK